MTIRLAPRYDGGQTPCPSPYGPWVPPAAAVVLLFVSENALSTSSEDVPAESLAEEQLLVTASES